MSELGWLGETGAYFRAGGGNVERPDDQKQVISWASWNIGADNGAGGDPVVFRRARELWDVHGITHFPWLHCRSIADIERLIQVAWQHPAQTGRRAIGLNLEDVFNDGIDLTKVAEILDDQWGHDVHLATLPVVQHVPGWGLLKKTVIALEIFPDENDESTRPAECIEIAFRQIGPQAKVTLMLKTKAPLSPASYGEFFKICHSLYTGDDITPTPSAWAAWRFAEPCTVPKPPANGDPMPPPKWFEKPYPKGPPVGPAKLARLVYPPDAAKKGKTPTPAGPDIEAFKRAAIRAQRWDHELTEIDDVYYNVFAHGKRLGRVATSGIAGIQRQEGIEDTGWIGDATYQAIRRARVPLGPNQGKPLFDARAVKLLEQAVEEFGQSPLMRAFYEWLDWFVRHEPEVGYDQARPIQPLAAKEKPPKLPSDLDCSGSLIYISWLAGLPSPDPNGYGGFGNTDSLRTKGTRIDPGRARSLARSQRVFAFYDNPDHVTACLTDGSVWSHGRESGPEYREEGIFYRSGFAECRMYPTVTDV